MAEKAKLKTYNIQASLNLVVSIEMSAVSLEDALEKAGKLSEGNFVDILGDYMDGKFRITGIYESEPS